MGGWGPRQPPAACQTPGLLKGTPLFETQPADSAGAAPCPAQPHTRKHTWPLLPLPLLPTSANLSPPLTKYKQNQPPLGMAPQLPAGLHPFRLPCQRSHWTLRLQGKPLAPEDSGPSRTSRDSAARCPCLLGASTPRSLGSWGLRASVTCVSHLLTFGPPRSSTASDALFTRLPVDCPHLGPSFPRGGLRLMAASQCPKQRPTPRDPQRRGLDWMRGREVGREATSSNI